MLSIPDEIVTSVIESSDYVSALEDVLEKAKLLLRFRNSSVGVDYAERLEEAIQDAELLR